MATGDDKGARCPQCEGVNTQLVDKTVDEAIFRCLNPKCTVGDYVELSDGMLVYSRPDVKA